MQSRRTAPRESRAYISAIIGGQNRYTLGRVRLDADATDETLRARRPLYLVGALLILTSLLIQIPLVFVAGLLILALAIVPELWYRYALRRLVVYPELATERAEIGDTVQVNLVIENRKALMLPYLEVEAQFPDALPLWAMYWIWRRCQSARSCAISIRSGRISGLSGAIARARSLVESIRSGRCDCV